jgi:hypothetical protein
MAVERQSVLQAHQNNKPNVKHTLSTESCSVIRGTGHFLGIACCGCLEGTRVLTVLSKRDVKGDG